jgi:uncharacterized membrane protein YeaQ/YmgE (transglycosylase-associated protein family)
VVTTHCTITTTAAHNSPHPGAPFALCAPKRRESYGEENATHLACLKSKVQTMSTIGVIIGWVVFGLVVGFIGRLLVPGRDPMGWLGTIAVGVAGSMIGGFLAQLFWGLDGEFEPASWIGSIIGAMLVVIGLRQLRPTSRLEER